MRLFRLLAVSTAALFIMSGCDSDKGEDPQDGSVDTAQPDTTEPDTTEPDTTEPDTTEPDTTEPDTTEPDTTEPDTTEPDTTEPDTTDRDTSDDDTAELDTTDDVDDTEDDVDDAVDDVEDDTVAPNSIMSKGDNCSDGVAIPNASLPFTDSDDSSTYAADFDFDSPCDVGWSLSTTDVVYTLTPDADATVAIDLDTAFDGSLLVTSSCGDGTSCVAVSDSTFASGVESVSIDVVAGTTYFIYVTAFEGAAGVYTLSVATGETCDNGVDDNGDNLPDCLDPQCEDAPNCDESNTELYGDTACTDDTDNDGDGMTDCADSDCASADACDEGDAGLYPGGCSDAIDNDGDGLTDCSDDDCDDADACDESNDTLYPNGCADNADNDGDGMTDCADSDCGDAPNCDEGNDDLYPGGCSDSADNDSDGAVDCADDDCALAVNCLATGDSCGDAFTLLLDTPVTNSTVDFNSLYGANDSICPGNSFSATMGGGYGTGPADIAYAFTPTQTAYYAFTIEQGNDSGLYIVTDCEDIENTCLGIRENFVTGTDEVLVVALDQGTTYYVIVDGWGSSATYVGEHTLSVTIADDTNFEINCTDELDGDADSSTDCSDLDCQLNGECITEICTDGIDNDADGMTDCDDDEVDADGELICPAHMCIAEVCDSGADTDGDGDTDCDDDECEFFIGCVDDGDLCEKPLLISLDAEDTFTDTQNLCDFNPTAKFVSGDGGCHTSSSNSSDVVYAYTNITAAPQRVVVEVDAIDSFNHMVAVISAGNDTECDPTSADDEYTMCTASASTASSGGTELLKFDAQPNTDYFIVVDGYQYLSSCGTTERNFELNVSIEEIETNCSDSVDDDNDGLTDCYDPDCGSDAVACPQGITGDSCESAIIVANVPFEQAGDTCNYNDDHKATSESNGCQSNSSSTTAIGKDIIFQFVAPQAGDYYAVRDTTWDNIINVVDGAPATPGGALACPAGDFAACVAGSDTPDDSAVFFTAAAAGDVFFIVLDGYASACGDYTFKIDLIAAEVCDDLDEADEDLDGDSNCDDDDCTDALNCNEAAHGAAACSDGVDNDGNGAMDCFDVTCADDAVSCPNGLGGGTCADPHVVAAVPFMGSFDTCGYNDDFTDADTDNGCTFTTGNHTGSDMVIEFTAPDAGNYVVRRQHVGGYWDSVVNVIDGTTAGCPSDPIAECVDGVDTETNAKVFFTANAPGDVFYIIVDAWSTACGGAEVSIESVPDEVCDDVDGVDEDLDGDVNCSDSDCAALNACDESTYLDGCTDEVDNDGDGDVDCDDSNCDGAAACDESTYLDGCTDEVDNDGDGVSDCSDSNCADLPVCDESTYLNGCTDTTDNDGDGDVDCDDSNCQVAEPAACNVPAGDFCGLQAPFDQAITALPYQSTGQALCDFTNNYAFSASNGCVYTAGGPEAIYTYTATADIELQITLITSDGADSILNVMEACPSSGPAGTCLASEDVFLDSALGDTNEVITIDITAGQTIYISPAVYGTSDCAGNTGAPFTLDVVEVVPTP